AARCLFPRAIDAEAERAGEDVIDVVVAVGVAARAAGARLQPPFRQRVALVRLGAIGMEHRTHPAHVVRAALPGSRDQRFSGCAWHVHDSLFGSARLDVTWTRKKGTSPNGTRGDATPFALSVARTAGGVEAPSAAAKSSPVRPARHPILPASASFGGLMVSPIRRDTTSARYITPTNISRLATARACTVIGMTSPMPVLDSSAKLKNSSSVQVRGACGSTAAEKQPGCRVWHSTNTKVNAHASRVKVAPAANSSSVVARRSASMYAVRQPAA